MRPTTTFFSIPTISMPWSARIAKGWSKLDEITPNLVVADPFEDQDDFLRGRKHEVYLLHVIAKGYRFKIFFSPYHDLLLNRHDLDGLLGKQDRQRMVPNSTE